MIYYNNLAMRHIQAYIPSYPVGTADDIAKMITDFIPIARAVKGDKEQNSLCPDGYLHGVPLRQHTFLQNVR